MFIGCQPALIVKLNCKETSLFRPGCENPVLGLYGNWFKSLEFYMLFSQNFGNFLDMDFVSCSLKFCVQNFFTLC